MEYSLASYRKFAFRSGDFEHDVYRSGAGPAVIIIHEIPGLHPLVIRFADRVAASGMSVYLPSLFGTPERRLSGPYIAKSFAQVALCMRREFSLWSSGRSSPVVDWLRALARRAHTECGGPGVGALGMCVTGGFALAMMTEPAVIAPVLAEPSLPLPMPRTKSAAIDASPEEIACARRRFDDENLSMIGLRFKGDYLVRSGRFDTYRREFGARFEAIELDDIDADPKAPGHAHSVLTIHLNDTDPDGPTRRAEARVINFFKERLSGSP